MQDVTPETEWHDLPHPCAYAALFGPVQRRRVDGRFVFGLLVQPKHANSGGIMHGGAMTALLDEVAGNTVHAQAERRHVTVHLDTTFLRRVEIGDFLETDCDVVRQTRSMTFIEVRLRVGPEIVATASLIFKAVPPHQR